MNANYKKNFSTNRTKYIYIWTYLLMFTFCWQFSMGALVVTPSEDFVSAGQEGGPFTPTSKEYSLYNNGSGTLYWGAEWDETWIDVIPQWSILDPNESVSVLVSLTTAAESLSEGTYADTVVFTDITNTMEYTRQVSLTVNPSSGFGLAAYWALDETEGTTAADSSGYGHDGTLINMDPNDWVAGKVGNCLDFDGTNDYVEMTGYYGIGGSGARTTCAWIRTTKAEGFILTYGTPVAGKFWLFALSVTGQLQLGVFGGNIIGTQVLTDGQWHHVAAVLDDWDTDGLTVSDLRLYIDGQPESGTYSTPEREIDTGADEMVHIGGVEGNPTVNFFNGQIDEVRMYDRALSEVEIAELAGISGPLAVWPDESFDTSGEPGGPFTPAYKDYTLKNLSDQSIYWGIDPLPDWLDVDLSFGGLDPGESTTVRVFLTEQADLLGEGFYSDTVVINNLSITQDPIERAVNLNIQYIGGIWTDPDSFELELTEGTTAQQTLRIGNDSAETYTFSIRTRSVQSGQSAQGSGGIKSISDRTEVSELVYQNMGLDYQEGEVLVCFKTDVQSQQALKKSVQENLLAAAGPAVVQRQYSLVPGLSLVQIPEGMTVEEAIQYYRGLDEVLYVQPNYRVYADSSFPNDPRFGDLWGLHNTGQGGGTADADIDAPEAWDFTLGSDQIVVAVIDTGVDYTHEDLAANMWINQPEWSGTPGVDDDGNGYVDDIYGYDFRNEDPNPMDDHYHGTHCAGTIGGVGNNGKGVTGVCWDVKIMALKFLSSAGGGNSADAIQCIEYGIQMGARVMSNSWGGTSYDQALYDAIESAKNAGVLFVAAAGNDGVNNDTYPHYPSSYTLPNVISVMATDRNEDRSGFSNYGPASVDLGAPGSSILSCEPGNQYQYLNGTSMACPHVSGACAALWSLNPTLSAEEVKNILLSTVDSTLPGLCVSGGRLNLYNAVLETKVPWLSFNIEEGTLGPDEYVDIQVTVNAMDLEPGTYAAQILILSDDPMHPTTVVPVELTVLPDPLVVWPEAGFDPNGFEGGPFEPDTITYTITNVGTQSIDWQLEYSVLWLDIDVTEGTLNPAESQEIHIGLDPLAYQLAPGLYEESLIFRNLMVNSQQFRSVELSVRPPDLFTESFENDFDLSNQTIVFRPEGGIAGYASCIEAEDVWNFIHDPQEGTYLSLGDDDFEEVLFGNGKQFSFYGTPYDRIYIGSNGYLSFGQGDWTYQENYENHFALPRISMLFSDLTPPNDECISWQQLEDCFVVTFEEIPVFGDKAATNSFQVELSFTDGTIRLIYLNVEADSSMVGLSKGIGFPEFFVESNLSDYINCCSCGDFGGDGLVGLSDLSDAAQAWLRSDCTGPDWCGRTDLNRDSIVDGADLSMLSQYWLKEAVEYDWSQPQFFPELNDGANIAMTPCLSRDGFFLYFARHIPSMGCRCIVQAIRVNPEGPFTSERVLSELSITGYELSGPWLSADGLRLYYQEKDETGKSFLKMAQRDPNEMTWTPVKVFPEITGDPYHASLTQDELHIFFCKVTPDGSISGSQNPMWTATRGSVHESFSNFRPLDELNSTNAHFTPRIMPDGLTIYFCSNREDESNFDIYRAKRSDRNDFFSYVEKLDVGNDSTHMFITSDEKSIYYRERIGTYVGIGMARLEKKQYNWSQPWFFPELNDGVNIALTPCLSRDGLSLYFGRDIPSLGCRCIVQATRTDQEGPFMSERVLSELSVTGYNVSGPWISSDGLRLYYQEKDGAGNTFLKMAQRDPNEMTWTPVKVFPEITDDPYHASLTEDELQIFFCKATSNGSNSGSPNPMWTATRTSVHESFSNFRPLDEINSPNVHYTPRIMPDGLTLYFCFNQYNETNFDIFRARRTERDGFFSYVEKIDVGDNSCHMFITPDEKSLYYFEGSLPLQGIWMTSLEKISSTCLPR